MSNIEGRYLGPLFVQEAPAGAVNGSNATFTLSQMPADSQSLGLRVNGLEQVEGTDYTISGQTITMIPAPAIGQTIEASYMKRTI